MLIAGVYTLVRCATITDKSQEDNNDTSAYAGSKSCEPCHKDIFQTHQLTAHFNTSRLATEATIMGSILPPGNAFHFDDGKQVRVEKQEDSIYQAAYDQEALLKRQTLDIVFGAGKHAQSYAHWSDNKLVQLPLTYFVNAYQWSNSPGYPDQIVFNRVITSRCLECHSTFAQVTEKVGYLEAFDKKSMIYGIDCEKCHGPASQHVAFQQKNPDDTIGKYIISTSSFTRAQKNDMCAVCHAGAMRELAPPFSFKSGDKLMDFYAYDIVASDVESLDVHGNQYGTLSLSKCFIKSEMTCGSCHSAHESVVDKTNVFSQKCMTCHSREKNNFCTVSGVEAQQINNNCIDCHMPNKPSKAILFTDEKTKQKSGIGIRTHLIKIYPEESQKVIAYIHHSKT